MYEAAVPRELRDRNIVAGKATIEKLVEERAFEKERNRKVRLIKKESDVSIFGNIVVREIS